jgi:hypothetical protein
MTMRDDPEARLTGGCNCGDTRYEATGPIRFRGQCFCRTCQSFSGGGPNLFVIVDAEGFRYVRGEPRRYCSGQSPASPTREFCGRCGSPLAARSPAAPGMMLVRVGSLDDPSLFRAPQVVVWTSQMQPFHQLPDGVPSFATGPRPPAA